MWNQFDSLWRSKYCSQHLSKHILWCFLIPYFFLPFPVSDRSLFPFQLTVHRRNLCAERHCVCKDCGVWFRGPAKLRTHRLTQHPAPDAPPPPDDGFTHRCPKCQQGFETEAELLEHQEKHAGDEYCNGKPPPRKRGRPPKQQQQQQVTPEAKNGEKEAEEAVSPEGEGGENSAESKTTKRRGRPPKQQQEVTEAKIPCPVADCKAMCSSVAQLRVHKKEAHPPPPPPRKAHACAECEESYGRAEQLEAHMRRAHGSDRHTCPTCGKSFGRESNLKAHQKTHSESEETDESKS